MVARAVADADAADVRGTGLLSTYVSTVVLSSVNRRQQLARRPRLRRRSRGPLYGKLVVV